MASSVTTKKGGRPTTFSVAAKAAASDPRQSTLSWAMVLKKPTIVGLYTDLGNQDRVTLWKTQLAHADEAIKAGTAVGFDFKF